MNATSVYGFEPQDSDAIDAKSYRLASTVAKTMNRRMIVCTGFGAEVLTPVIRRGAARGG